jgi:hypothetical protein
MGRTDMNTYRCCVRVAKAGGIGTMVVWAQVTAQNSYAARLLLDAQFGRDNVVGVPTQVS